MKTHLTLTALAVVLAFAPQARAGLTFTLKEVGGDVVVTATGTVNTTALTLLSDWSSTDSYIRPDQATLIIAPTTTLGPIYFGINGPSSFGSGSTVTLATSSSGDNVLFEGLSGQIGLPNGYTSGAALSSSMTFAGTTLSDLGVTPGTYTYTWGSGADADFVKVEAGDVTAVPGPSSLVLLGAGAACLAGWRWRRKGVA